MDDRCDVQQGERRITGHAEQFGQVLLGTANQVSGAGSWDFDLRVADGTCDLFAPSEDRIAVRRDAHRPR